jgi:hypothetical protein
MKIEKDGDEKDTIVKGNEELVSQIKEIFIQEFNNLNKTINELKIEKDEILSK